MAATNIQSHRVYGPGVVQVGTATNNTLETLGVTLDGVNIRIIQHKEPVYNDVGGPSVPVDYADMGEEARISFTLQNWTEDVLRRLKARARTALSSKAAVFGDIAPRGRLLGGPTSGAFGLFFPPSSQTNTSDLWEESWFFGCCTLDRDPEEFRIGTVSTKVRVSVIAYPFIPGTLVKLPTVSGDNAFGKLYQRGANTTAPTYIAPS